MFETPNFGDRYYTFQIGYADTECDTCPGRRTHGSQLPPLFIHGRSYAGPVPDGMLEITSRTRYVMICGRVLVQPEDPDDPARVRALQEQMRLRTLTRWKSGDDDANPVPAERPLPGLADVDDVDLVFLHQLGAVLAEDPVDDHDGAVVASFAHAGATAQRLFDPEAISDRSGHGDRDRPARRRGARRGEDRPSRPGRQRLVGEPPGIHVRRRPPPPGGGGQEPDLRRAGRGSGLPRRPSRWQRRPTRWPEPLHPATNEPPPTDAFWSLTVYGIPGPLISNPLGRYAIGDRTPGLDTTGDGAITVHLQHNEPAEGPSNWLPVPTGRSTS